MNKQVVVSAAAAIALCAFGIFSAHAYNSDGDPLITLSYLKEVFLPEIREEFSNLFASPDTESEQKSGFEVVELYCGQVLKSKEGTLEVIVRPGSSAVVVSESDIGISDITDGNELYNSDIVPINHSCLIPRADSRGIEILSDVAYLLVRGGYTVE